MGSAADYLERVRSFAGRARLLTPSADAMFAELIAALRYEADEEEPTKRAKVRAFRENHSLADIVRKAVALVDEADRQRRGSAAAATFVREAAVLALLVNTGDRQGDLSRLRIGHEIVRDADGRWFPEFAQAKTRWRKENGALWPITSAILDRHVLGDRPEWAIDQRLDELANCNLLSLGADGLDTYYPSTVLKKHFGLSGHLIRTLITDALRIHRPDAAWAAQFMLGHTNSTMQETYRTDFRDRGVIRNYHAAIDALN
jgi:integrase